MWRFLHLVRKQHEAVKLVWFLHVYKAVCVWVGVCDHELLNPHSILCLQNCMAAFFSSSFLLKSIVLRCIFQTYVWTEAIVFILLDWRTTDYSKRKRLVCDYLKGEETDWISVWSLSQSARSLEMKQSDVKSHMLLKTWWPFSVIPQELKNQIYSLLYRHPTIPIFTFGLYNQLVI